MDRYYTYRPLLDLAGFTEGTDKGDGYNETLAYGAYTGGDVDLCSMTLKQVDALQTKMLQHPANKLNSSAVGRYQIIRTTLRSIRKTLGLSMNALFDEDMQDRLACYLLGVRGIDKYLAGRLSEDTLINNLAKEWASFPTTASKGHYQGQHSPITADRMREVLAEVRRRHMAGQDIPEPARKVVEKTARDKVTEIGAICTGVGGTAATVKEAVDATKETGATLLSFGPWVLLAVAISGFAGYIYWQHRSRKKEAKGAIAAQTVEA